MQDREQILAYNVLGDGKRGPGMFFILGQDGEAGVLYQAHARREIEDKLKIHLFGRASVGVGSHQSFRP